jgi:cyclic beta-1,2-glucan synthetase
VIALAMLGDGAGAAALFSLLNPVNHAASDAGMRRYRVEPYVVAADVYSVAPHVGRGGWTWYTGAAGWLYRAGVEAILGLRRAGATLVIDPCIPPSWPRYEMTFRHGGTCYDIVVENPDGVARGVVETVLDGVSSRGHECRIPLGDDGLHHRVRVVLGDAAALRDE